MISTYFQLGFTHILDLAGYDHMLFLLLLISGIKLNQRKELLGLITAFTLGHSITLALVTLYKPLIPSNLVEFLIPITILITGLQNLLSKSSTLKWKVSLTLFFGLIHGMGFASYLTALMPHNSSVWQPLLFFNLGVEAGQIVFAGLFISLMLLIPFTSKTTVQRIQNIISVIGVVISIFLAASNWPYL